MKHKVSAVLIKGTIILTLFSFLGKALGALFKISLTNLIGTEGIGIYGLVFPVFVFFELLSSEGFNVGLTVYVAKYNNSKDVSYAYKTYAFKLIIISALFSALIISLLSSVLSKLQGGVVSAILYIEIALCVVSVSLLSYFKGVVRGEEDFKLFSISEAIEDLSKILFGLLLAYLFKDFGVEASVAGVFGGIIISSILSIFIILICGKRYFKRRISRPLSKEECDKFLRFSVLASLSALVVPSLQFVDSILIVRLLGSVGLTPEVSTRLFGLSRGSVSALLNLPAFLLVSFEFLLLPSLSRSGVSECRDKTSLGLNLVLFVTIPFFLLYVIFPQEILIILYGKALSVGELYVATRLLKIGAISLMFSALSGVVVLSIESNGHTLVPFVASIVAGILKLSFLIAFVPKLSIYGAELSSVLFTLVEALIIFVYAFKKRYFCKINWLWLVVIFWIVVFGLIYLLYIFLASYFKAVWAFGASVSIMVLLFLIIGMVVFVIMKKKKYFDKFLKGE